MKLNWETSEKNFLTCTWNAAIEDAARVAFDPSKEYDYPPYGTNDIGWFVRWTREQVAKEIRKLKR